LNADERQHRIVALARRQGEVDVAKLAAELAVSAETIRRDLRLLEEHGLLRRTHGGAYPVETAKFETDLAMRTTYGVPEKRRIAATAVSLIGDAETVAFADVTLGSIEHANPQNPGLQPRPAIGVQFVGIPEFADLGTKVSQEVSAAVTGSQTVDQALNDGQKLAEAVAKNYK
jgi:DNA-binding Lrp family transcriptional regulator